MLVKAEVSNSGRVSTGGRWPPKLECGWILPGGSVRRASPAGVLQRRTFRTSPWTTIRYPTTPCSPGGSPVVIDVSAVAVVDGATGVKIGRASRRERVWPYV